MLTRFANARVQGLLTIPASELWRTDAPVIRWIVFLHSIISMFKIVLVIDVIIVVAFRGSATFFRVLLRSSLVDRGAVRSFASYDIHAILVSAFSSFLDSPAFATVAEIFFEDRLAGGSVLAGQIGARVFTAFFHAIGFEDVLVVAHVEVRRLSVDLDFSYAAEKTMICADVVVNSEKLLGSFKNI